MPVGTEVAASVQCYNHAGIDFDVHGTRSGIRHHCAPYLGTYCDNHDTQISHRCLPTGTTENAERIRRGRQSPDDYACPFVSSRVIQLGCGHDQ